MTQTVAGKSIPGIFMKQGIPPAVKVTCLSRVSTYDSSPLVSDA